VDGKTFRITGHIDGRSNAVLRNLPGPYRAGSAEIFGAEDPDCKRAYDLGAGVGVKVEMKTARG